MSDTFRDSGAPFELASLQIKRTSTAEQVAEAMREMILHGDLEQGQPLREVALAESIGVSRNTMREAIRVLAREGLVTHQMHHGAVVTRLDARSVEDIFRVRQVLELAAVHASVDAEPGQLTQLDDAVRALDQAVGAGDWGGTIDADELFHERLVGMLNSRRISRFFDAIQTEIRLCMSIVDRSQADPRVLVAEHQELLELIVHRELDRAREVLAADLAASEEMLKQVVQQHESKSAVIATEGIHRARTG